MAHLDQLKWAEEEFPLQGDFAATSGGETVVVTGICPRCKGQTSWTFRKGEMGAVAAEDVETLQKLTPTIICACGHMHDERPDDSDEDGCGAFWKVAVAP
jgi:hypothetical protein